MVQTPEQRREAQRLAKQRSRAKARAEGKPPEIDKRTAESRRKKNAERQRNYRAKKKSNNT